MRCTERRADEEWRSISIDCQEPMSARTYRPPRPLLKDIPRLKVEQLHSEMEEQKADALGPAYECQQVGTQDLQRRRTADAGESISTCAAARIE